MFKATLSIIAYLDNYKPSPENAFQTGWPFNLTIYNNGIKTQDITYQAVTPFLLERRDNVDHPAFRKVLSTSLTEAQTVTFLEAMKTRSKKMREQAGVMDTQAELMWTPQSWTIEEVQELMAKQVVGQSADDDCTLEMEMIAKGVPITLRHLIFGFQNLGYEFMDNFGERMQHLQDYLDGSN